MVGDGRKTPKERVKIEQNEHPFGYPPTSQSIKRRPTVFRSPRGTKTNRAFPSGEGRLD